MADGGNHFANDEEYQREWVSMVVYALLYVEHVKSKTHIEYLSPLLLKSLADESADRYMMMKKGEFSHESTTDC